MPAVTGLCAVFLCGPHPASARLVVEHGRSIFCTYSVLALSRSSTLPLSRSIFYGEERDELHVGTKAGMLYRWSLGVRPQATQVPSLAAKGRQKRPR